MSNLTLTQSAARRIAELVKAEGGMALRLAVDGGGCSGFQYSFTIAKSEDEDDLSLEQYGVKVLIDPSSLELIKGSELDYVENLGGSYFSVNNPNATSSCGCGNSFSL